MTRNSEFVTPFECGKNDSATNATFTRPLWLTRGLCAGVSVRGEVKVR